MSEHKEPIPSMIYNASVGGHVTNSQQIIDENENKEQSQINAEVKQNLGQGGSVDARISQAKNDIIGGASSNGNTLKKIEDRVLPIESAVGTGGNIDTRIEAAVNIEKTRAEEKESTLNDKITTEKIRAEEAEGNLDKKIDILKTIIGPGDNVNSRISDAIANETTRAQNVESTLQTNIDTEILRAQTAEEQLRTLYNNLQQSKPIPITELPNIGEEGKIYRLAGTTSYSDYMWNNNKFIKMATYNNAIDNKPIIESENLVKSGGVYDAIDDVINEMYAKVGGTKYFSKEVSQDSRTGEHDVYIESGYTVKVTLLSDGITPSSGIRIRGLATDNTYIQFGSLTAVGQTLTQTINKDISGIDTYNYDAHTSSSFKVEWEKTLIGSVNEDISEINNTITRIEGNTDNIETEVTTLKKKGSCFNVNLYNSAGTYASSTDARNAIPIALREEGMTIAYLLNDGWHYEHNLKKDSNSARWAISIYWRELCVDMFHKVIFDSWDIAAYTLTDGYLILDNCTPTASPTYSYSSPIRLLKGETIIAINLSCSVGIAAISLTQQTPSTYTKVVSGHSDKSVFKYTATENCYVAICGKSVSFLKDTVIVAKNSDQAAILDRLKTLEITSASLEKLAADGGEIVTVTTSSSGTGKIILYSVFASPVSASENANYNVSNPISVPAHSLITTYCYGASSRISKVAPEDKYIPLVEGISNPNTCVSWINNSDEAVNVVICYMPSQPISVFIHKNVFASILSTIPNIERYGTLNDTTPSLTFVSGSVSNGVITSDKRYIHSAPFYANKNDLIILIQSRYGENSALLYKTDATASFVEHIIPGIYGNTIQYRYYVCKESGYYGISGAVDYLAMKKYTPSGGYINTTNVQDKRKVNVTYSKTSGASDITISDDIFCQITNGLGKKIAGFGDCTIRGTLESPVIGRCLSIGLKIPYATQDVADVTIQNEKIEKATTDSRTASGKAYKIEGDHYHRINYNIKYDSLSSFTIVIESDTDWIIGVSADAVINDDLPITPVMVGYDAAYNYHGVFQYEGDTISVYELHKRLQIPYYVATTKEAGITNPEVAEAVQSGLCEIVFYGGGDLVPYWSTTDGSLAEQIFNRKAAVGSAARMYVSSQGVLDRNMYFNIVNSGVEIIRHWAFFKERGNVFSQKYGDNDVYYSIAAALGQTIVTDILKLPQVYYGHGIGTPSQDDPDPYFPSHYTDFDGSNTIALFNMWKTMQEQGRLAVMKPSDFIAYLKKCH